jgi:hypothetical protein
MKVTCGLRQPLGGLEFGDHLVGQPRCLLRADQADHPVHHVVVDVAVEQEIPGQVVPLRVLRTVLLLLNALHVLG